MPISYAERRFPVRCEHDMPHNEKTPYGDCSKQEELGAEVPQMEPIHEHIHQQCVDREIACLQGEEVRDLALHTVHMPTAERPEFLQNKTHHKGAQERDNRRV